MDTVQFDQLMQRLNDMSAQMDALHMSVVWANSSLSALLGAITLYAFWQGWGSGK